MERGVLLPLLLLLREGFCWERCRFWWAVTRDRAASGSWVKGCVSLVFWKVEGIGRETYCNI
jgi:hypothetical protein